jgi:general stress protein 26
MTRWQQFAVEAPELARFGLSRLRGRVAYLATLRRDGSPRLHPVVVHFGNSELFLYMNPASPKAHDLRRDPRYTLHCAVEDTNGGEGEISISGCAEVIADPATRAALFEAAERNGFHPKDGYILFELSVEKAISTVYAEGEPKTKTWSSNRET